MSYASRERKPEAAPAVAPPQAAPPRRTVWGPPVRPQALAESTHETSAIGTQLETEGTGATVTHTVKKGETLHSIASMHGITVRALQVLNPGLPEPTKLQIGTRLWLHFGTPEKVPLSFGVLNFLETIYANPTKQKRVNTAAKASNNKTLGVGTPAPKNPGTFWPDPFNAGAKVTDGWLLDILPGLKARGFP